MNPKLILFNLCLLAILIPLTLGFPYKNSHEEEDEDEEEEDKWGKFGKFGKYGKYGKSYGDEEEEEKEKDDYGKKLFFPFLKKEEDTKPKWSSGGWSPVGPPSYGNIYGQGKYNPKYFKSYDQEEEEEEEYPKKKKSYKKKSKKEEISKDILKEVDKFIPEIDFVDEEKKKA